MLFIDLFIVNKEIIDYRRFILVTRPQQVQIFWTTCIRTPIYQIF